MKIWPILLGCWLVLQALTSLIKLNFQYHSVILASLALVAGIFAVIQR